MNNWEIFYDTLFVITAVSFNLLVVGIYIAQARQRENLVRTFGGGVVFLILPLDLVFVGYVLNGRSLEILAALSLVFLYLMAELLLDFILKFDFRSKPIWHAAYILLFYAATFSLIGIAFTISDPAGYFVSVTFWAVLGALIYLMWRKNKQNNGSFLEQH